MVCSNRDRSQPAEIRRIIVSIMDFARLSDQGQGDSSCQLYVELRVDFIAEKFIFLFHFLYITLAAIAAIIIQTLKTFVARYLDT